MPKRAPVVETIAGTVLGTALSLLASIAIARREVRRSAQIRILEELPSIDLTPPRVVNYWDDGRPMIYGPNTAMFPGLIRQASIAGKSTLRQVRELQAAIERCTRPASLEEKKALFGEATGPFGSNGEMSPEDRARFVQANEVLDQLRGSDVAEAQRVFKAFDEHLQRKIV